MSEETDTLHEILAVIKSYLSLESDLSADHLASQIRRLTQTEGHEQLHAQDRKFMELAVQQAELQRIRYGDDDGGDRPNPFVGCVVVTKSGKSVVSYRGDGNRNDHAEYIALQIRGLTDEELVDAEVFTTLEPCSERGPSKTPCADWLIKKRVRRVAVALWDVDPRGQGLRKLAEAGIEITHFPADLREKVAKLNAKFIASRLADKDFVEIKKVERFYKDHRPLIQNIFRDMDLGYDLREFPLITKPGLLLQTPQLLCQGPTSCLGYSLSKECFPNAYFRSDKYSEMFIGSTYSEFKVRFCEQERQDPHLHDGYTYRLMQIDTGHSGLSLKFARSKYFSFIDTCEALAFEAATFAFNRETKINKSYSMTLRQSLGGVYDLSNRNAVLGINSGTLLLDRGTGRCSLIGHRRRRVAEAVNTIHVVPAGTFQPLASDRFGGWEDAAWERDFSILDNIVREFMEEVLGMGRKIRFAARIGDWRTMDEEVSAAYNLIMTAIKDKNGSKADCRVWFFGVGFDPVNWKPEMLTAIVMDREFFYALRPHWNEEGRAHNIEFSEYEVNNILEHPNDSWLSAGVACVHLIRSHYTTLRACLN